MSVPTSVEPGLEFVVTATLIVADVTRSTAFYRDVLGAEVLRTGEPTFLHFGNIWLTINLGGLTLNVSGGADGLSEQLPELAERLADYLATRLQASLNNIVA